MYDPFTFWERQRLFDADGISWNSVAGIFTVCKNRCVDSAAIIFVLIKIYTAKAEITNKVLKMNGPDSFILALHPNGRKVRLKRNKDSYLLNYLLSVIPLTPFNRSLATTT